MAADEKDGIPEVSGLDTSDQEGKKASTGGGGKLKAMAIQIGILVTLTGAAFGLNMFLLKPILVVNGQEATPEPVATPRGEQYPGKILALDPAIVNIAGTNGRRYLKVTVQIEVPEEETLVKEVEARKPLLSDRLIQILTSKPLEEVTNAGSLQNLKQQIADQFGKELGADRLKNIYFTEFVIQ